MGAYEREGREMGEQESEMGEYGEGDGRARRDGREGGGRWDK